MDFTYGVDWRDPDPELLEVTLSMDALHLMLTGVELVVTSGRRPPGQDDSLHSPPDDKPFRAVDVRRWYLDARGLAWVFAQAVRWRFHPDVQVVCEPENLTTRQIELRGGTHRVEPHIHVEVDR